MSIRRREPPPRPVPDRDWSSWDDERLLDVRMCDLDLDVSANGLGTCIQQLQAEIDARGLRFKPHFWLSDDWFTPDGIPGMAIPFFLAHPRLARLEEALMLEVEGGNRAWCMRILRHETGHAIENAFRLRRRRERVKLFGRSSAPYPKYYTPKPYSKRYVIHLESWYAQSHPDEDFAETFAVWLNPESDWRRRYAGWPALKKLEYVDGLMAELAGRKPPVRSRARLDPISGMRKTLRQHYQDKRDYYGMDYPYFYDRDLRRLFSSAPEHRGNLSAARFISGIRREVRRQVRRWTGVYQYTIDQVLKDVIERCRELDLHLSTPEEQARAEFSVLLTVQTMTYLHGGRHRIAL